MVAAEEEVKRAAGGLGRAGTVGVAGSLCERSTVVERMRQWYGRARALGSAEQERAKARAVWERRPGGRLARTGKSGRGAGGRKAIVEVVDKVTAVAEAAAVASAGGGSGEEDEQGVHRKSEEGSGGTEAAAKSRYEFAAAPPCEDNSTDDEDSGGGGGGEVRLEQAETGVKARAEAKAKARGEGGRRVAKTGGGGGDGGDG